MSQSDNNFLTALHIQPFQTDEDRYDMAELLNGTDSVCRNCENRLLWIAEVESANERLGKRNDSLRWALVAAGVAIVVLGSVVAWMMAK